MSAGGGRPARWDMFNLAERNKRAWDDLYGATEQPVWGRLPIGFLHEFLGYVTPTLGPGSRVLDAAGGEGRNVRALEQTQAWVCLCDASTHGLRKVRSVVHARVPCTQCDVGALPFESGLFDLVLMTDVIETLPDPNPALAEASRVLKPGGMLICNIPGEGDPISDREMDGIGDEAYMYRGRYFYRFVDADAGAELLRHHQFDIARAEARTWTEEAHPSFRSYAHDHISNVFLGVKR